MTISPEKPVKCGWVGALFTLAVLCRSKSEGNPLTLCLLLISILFFFRGAEVMMMFGLGTKKDR